MARKRVQRGQHLSSHEDTVDSDGATPKRTANKGILLPLDLSCVHAVEWLCCPSASHASDFVTVNALLEPAPQSMMS